MRLIVTAEAIRSMAWKFARSCKAGAREARAHGFYGIARERDREARDLLRVATAADPWAAYREYAARQAAR
jgi:hypothetical protein